MSKEDIDRFVADLKGNASLLDEAKAVSDDQIDSVAGGKDGGESGAATTVTSMNVITLWGPMSVANTQITAVGGVAGASVVTT